MSMQTPSKFSRAGRIPLSTPRYRPKRTIQRLSERAKAAPYAYTPHSRQLEHRPETPPRAASDLDIKHEQSEKNHEIEHRRFTRDPMPFSLLDDSPRGYRYPSVQERDEISLKFPSIRSMTIEHCLILFECRSPPTDIPLTVAGLPAIFLSQNEEYRPIPGVTGDPRVADPLFESRYDQKSESRIEFLQRAIRCLFDMNLKPVAVSIFLDVLVVELKDCIDESTLPGYLGGFIPYYCAGYAAWKNEKQYHNRLIQLTAECAGYSDYRNVGLTPGVHVCGIKSVGTAGLLLKNVNTGEKRLTVSDHVFEDTDAVFHPRTSEECRIGTITDRYPELDIAMVKLHDDIQFTNSSYFEAQVPRQLAGQDWMPTNEPYKPWFFLDSAYTGCLPLLYCGVKAILDENAQSEPVHKFEFRSQSIFRSMNTNFACLKDGICGSPLVVDSSHVSADDEGTVLGFFCYAHDGVPETAFVPILDKLIEEGWRIDVE